MDLGGDQVNQLLWDGRVVKVCSLGGCTPPVLAGALADRLLILRGSPNGAGGVDISPRALGLLQPLTLGWVSCASTGILPGERDPENHLNCSLVRLCLSVCKDLSSLAFHESL